MQTIASQSQAQDFFNAPTDDPEAFGLGYEELDAHNIPVPGTFLDVKPFDPMTPTVCLPLGLGNTPVIEPGSS